MSALSPTCDVLVVGAGPTGLLTALELARAGLAVEIVDRAPRPADQSYACGLHAASLEILSRNGLIDAALAAGLETRTLAFYQGGERKAQVQLNAPGLTHPFVLVLPQERLEELLEGALREKGIRVRWGHRLDDFKQDDQGVSATVEQLGLTSIGYPVVRSEETVENEIEVRAQYLVAADGCHSHVRAPMGIEMDRLGPTRAFEFIEFASPADVPAEIRVAVAPEGLTDAFWPQPGGLCRWSLDLGERAREAPGEHHGPTVVLDDEADRAHHARTLERIRSRAPWFTGGIQEVNWNTVVAFESSVAQEFGRGRVWLVGDAAHQTSPVGMQSMNIGLLEAQELAAALVQAVKNPGGGASALPQYGQSRRLSWRGLLGATGGLGAGPDASEWARAHRGRLLGCLPASGLELTHLSGQLGLIPGCP